MAIFITGTDTGIGKTLASSLILSALKETGLKPGYFKPIQTGEETDSSAIALLSPNTFILDPTYSFLEPWAPSRCAHKHGKRIDLKQIQDYWNQRPDYTWVVEGIGGSLVPLNKTERVLDLIKLLDLSTLVIASTRLGTINHTFLTLEALQNQGIRVAGLVLSGPEDPGLEETFSDFTQIPVIAHIPQLSEINASILQKIACTIFPKELLKKLFSPEPTKNLSERDAKVIWHPYAQHGLLYTTLPVIHARGGEIHLEDKSIILDAISSWWVNLHGHSHPQIAKGLAQQCHTLEHVLFAGFTHEPAVKLAETLIKNSPFSRVFYADNGSTAVECALKIAYQYHRNQGDFHRKKFLALKNAYHGDTFGAMAVGSNPYHWHFKDLCTEVDFVEPEDYENFLKYTEKNRYAAFIFEPLVQAAGGMRMYSQTFLKQALIRCQSLGILTIADEVFTGFFRTGKCFAFEYLTQTPDILCLSKGLTGGFLPLSATLVSKSIFEAFCSKKMEDAFLHGHSYTANPLACTSACISWELLHEPRSLERRKKLEAITQERIQEIQKRYPDTIENARYLGTIGAVELHEKRTYFTDPPAALSQKALKQGILLRPLGNVLYTVPPYCLSDEQLHRVYDVIESLIPK